jgi:mono/diheme cytochrome c family protein
MKKKMFYLIPVMAFMAFLALAAFTHQAAPKPWPVPDTAKKQANPVKNDAASIAAGKALYNKHCKSCHGTKGKGDGTKAAQLDTDCGDFSTAAFQSQTDGALYYKTAEGRKDMPSFKKKIPDADEIWSIVNYMRTFK